MEELSTHISSPSCLHRRIYDLRLGGSARLMGLDPFCCWWWERERKRGVCVLLCVGFGFDRFWGSWVGVTVCIWNIGILADDCCRLPYNSSSRKWVSAFGCFHSWWSCCKEVFKSEWGHEGNEEWAKMAKEQLNPNNLVSRLLLEVNR